jgi:alpha-L-fucosidase
MTIDKNSWGHRSDAKLEDFLTSEELIRELVTTVACNGNLLVNVGPTRYGTIEAIFAERLRDMGKWLRTNGKAIYGTRPWEHQSEGKDIWYSMKVGSSRVSVFVIVLEYPFDTNTIVIKELGRYMDKASRVTMLGFDEAIEVRKNTA